MSPVPIAKTKYQMFANEGKIVLRIIIHFQYQDLRWFTLIILTIYILRCRCEPFLEEVKKKIKRPSSADLQNFVPDPRSERDWGPHVGENAC